MTVESQERLSLIMNLYGKLLLIGAEVNWLPLIAPAEDPGNKVNGGLPDKVKVTT